MFWELKFYKNKKTAKIFADVFYQNIFDILNKLSLEENFNNPILIPIPLFFTNKIKRSYNQNSLILKYFKKLNKTNPDIIEIKYILKK